MRIIVYTLAVALSVFSISLQAQSIRQRSTTEGFNLSLQGHYMGWSSDYFQFLDERAGSGAGFSGRAGFGFNQRYEAFLQYNYSAISATDIAGESFRYTHLTPGIRVNFSSTTRALRPFAELGYVYQTGKLNQVLNEDGYYDNLLFKGGAAHIGAGLSYFLSLPIAITLNGSVQAAGKADVQINGQNTGERADLTSFRISAGLVLYLSEL